MHTPITWETESGSVSVLPERGRIISIEVSGRHALWQPVRSDEGWNFGGERLWIAPESDWFWKQTGRVDFKHYQVPPGLDPDNWTITQADDESCSSEFYLHLDCFHSDKTIDLKIHRRFELLPPGTLAGTAPSVAFRTTTGLEILGGTHGQPVDLWSILQVPIGGEMVVPVNQKISPRDYFSPCPITEMIERNGEFRLKTSGHSMFKIGLRPDQANGLIAYERPVPGGLLVLQRSFPIYCGLRYCDSPLNDLRSQGDAVQFFCDDGTFGGFAEMEHHSPAIRCGVGPQTLTESTITIASILPTP